MKDLRKKAFNKVDKKLKDMGCQSIIKEINQRGGVFSIIFDLYESLHCGVDDFKSAYESVLKEGIEKENIIDLEGDCIYKDMKMIANYAYQLYFDQKLKKEHFFELLNIQSKRFYKEMDESNRDWEQWDHEIDFLWWIYAVLKLKEKE